MVIVKYEYDAGILLGLCVCVCDKAQNMEPHKEGPGIACIYTSLLPSSFLSSSIKHDIESDLGGRFWTLESSLESVAL